MTELLKSHNFSGLELEFDPHDESMKIRYGLGVSRYKSAGGEKLSVKCGSVGPSRVALGHLCPRHTKSQPPF